MYDYFLEMRSVKEFTEKCTQVRHETRELAKQNLESQELLEETIRIHEEKYAQYEHARTNYEECK